LSVDSPQQVIREHGKAYQRCDLVTVLTMPWADCDRFFCCIVFSELSQMKPMLMYKILWPKTAHNGSETRHHDQCLSTLSSSRLLKNDSPNILGG
jgi:hypothetical protein